jgi:hypothetical protein
MLHGSVHTPTAVFVSRKRRHPSCSSLPPPTVDSAQGSPKRRKVCHPTFPPPRFWDGLSTIALSANALRELNRRNTQRERSNADVAYLPPPRRSRRLRARRAITEENDSSLPVDRFLRRCSSPCLKQLKRFATHGGPDLRDLRGVRTFDWHLLRN